jgi:16S rRNA (cytosine1402-N4)-methyltransferase
MSMGGEGVSNPLAGGPAQHHPVLRAEAVTALRLRAGGIYVDGTFGAGGYTRALLDEPDTRVIAIDRDPAAAETAAALAARFPGRFTFCPGRFGDLDAIVREQGLAAVNGVVLDIGVSSMQLDQPERGFSFRFDGPLDMRMDTTRGESAAQFLARADERHIAEVIKNYGEERFALQVAKALVARREGGHPVRTTRELSDVVARAVKTREPGQDPATRTFQALRIFVNAELEELAQGLKAALELLVPGGRLVVISFHSLEDRIVKTFIARESRSEVDRRVPMAPEKPTRLRSLGRVKPGETELRANPRARSAIMRVAERTSA